MTRCNSLHRKHKPPLGIGIIRQFNPGAQLKHFYANPTESVARAVSFSIGISIIDILSMTDVKLFSEFEISFTLDSRPLQRMTLTPASDILRALPTLQAKSYITLKRNPDYDYFHPLTAHYFPWLHAYCSAEFHFDKDEHGSLERFLRKQGLTVYCSIVTKFTGKVSVKKLLFAMDDVENHIRHLIFKELTSAAQISE